MGVALGGARQVGHEFHPQGLLDLVENILLHAFHAQHTLHHFQRKLFRQSAKNPRGMLRLDLGEHHRNGLGIFVLEIVGQHRLVHIGQLVPHGAPGGTADFLHDRADLFGRQDVGQQSFGGFVRAHQRAGARHLGDKIHQKLLDQAGGHRTHVGHDLGDFLDLLLIHHLPDLLGMVFAQRQHDDGRTFRARERADIFLNWSLEGFRHDLDRLVQPGADDRQRLFRMGGDHFTDFLDGRFPHLTVDAADVDVGFGCRKRLHAVLGL